MRSGENEIRLALAEGGGVIARRTRLDLRPVLDHAVRTGRLLAVLPGTYVDAGQAQDPLLLARAAMAWSPDAVVTGRLAAQLTFWPGLAVRTVELAARRTRSGMTLYRCERRSVDPDLVMDVDGLRLTCPPLTALDLCTSLGGDPIDTVLRSRRATLADLRMVLARSPHRRGNNQRRALVLDSRDEPWSAAERLLHRILREAGLSGWRANHPVTVNGHRYYLDVAFARARLAIEVDGRCHALPAAFEADRWRQNELVLDGWRVLRFTWAMLVEAPELVLEAVLTALHG